MPEAAVYMEKNISYNPYREDKFSVLHARAGKSEDYARADVALMRRDHPTNGDAAFGTAEVGAGKFSKSGVDHGIRANINLMDVTARDGPKYLPDLGIKLGMGADTSVKRGEGSVGAKVCGTGVQIGKVTEVSWLGSSVKLDIGKWFK